MTARRVYLKHERKTTPIQRSNTGLIRDCISRILKTSVGKISRQAPVLVRLKARRASRVVFLGKMEDVMVKVKGRHDPCILPRVLPVLESMLALVLADHAIRGGFIGKY